MGISDYNKEFLKSLAYSRKHFWYSHRNEIIYRTITQFCRKKNPKILELGAGSGNVLSFLSAKNLDVDGSDIYSESLSYISERAGKVFKYDLGVDPRKTEVKDLKEKYEVIILADIVEHLNDPVLAMRNAKYFCKKKGIIIITVPALAKLWSEYDAISGHKRRYSRDTLKREIQASGLECIFIRYFFFLTSIFLFLRRRIVRATPKFAENAYSEEFIKREFKINTFFNALFTLIGKVELFIGKFLSFPFGSSIIAVGRVSS